MTRKQKALIAYLRRNYPAGSIYTEHDERHSIIWRGTVDELETHYEAKARAKEASSEEKENPTP